MRGAKPQNPCSRGGAVYIYTNQLFQNYIRKSKLIIKVILIRIRKRSKHKFGKKEQCGKNDKLSDFGSNFGTSCLALSWVARFVWDLFFGTSEGEGGTPSTDFDLSWGTLWSNSVDFLEDSRSKFAPNVKDCRTAFRYFVNKLHQPHLKTN